jgi:hypothetical protein
VLAGDEVVRGRLQFVMLFRNAPLSILSLRGCTNSGFACQKQSNVEIMKGRNETKSPMNEVMFARSDQLSFVRI